MKQYIWPSLTKIIIFFITMLGFNYLLIISMSVLDGYSYEGIPFVFYRVGNLFMPPGQYSSSNASLNLSKILYVNLFLDVFFWYFFSCTLVFLLKKILKH